MARRPTSVAWPAPGQMFVFNKTLVALPKCLLMTTAYF